MGLKISGETLKIHNNITYGRTGATSGTAMNKFPNPASNKDFELTSYTDWEFLLPSTSDSFYSSKSVTVNGITVSYSNATRRVDSSGTIAYLSIPKGKLIVSGEGLDDFNISVPVSTGLTGIVSKNIQVSYSKESSELIADGSNGNRITGWYGYYYYISGGSTRTDFENSVSVGEDLHVSGRIYVEEL